MFYLFYIKKRYIFIEADTAKDANAKADIILGEEFNPEFHTVEEYEARNTFNMWEYDMFFDDEIITVNTLIYFKNGYVKFAETRHPK